MRTHIFRSLRVPNARVIGPPGAGKLYPKAAGRADPNAQHMVWSLSKDDDGLDSVLPLADESRAKAPAVTPASGRAEPSQERILVQPGEQPPGQPRSGSASIVVDPESQVPEAPRGQEAVRRRSVEATQILQGRRLDNLRAEVARRRVAHQRKKQRALLIWAGAGGVALCLGWGAGLALSPEKSASAGGSPASGTSLPAPQGTARKSPASPLPPSSEISSSKETMAPSKAPAELGTISLDDIPEDLGESAAEDTEAEKLAAPSEGAPAAPVEEAGDGETFTLDDLPAD